MVTVFMVASSFAGLRPRGSARTIEARAGIVASGSGRSAQTNLAIWSKAKRGLRGNSFS